MTAPIGRVKVLLQTQDINASVLSGSTMRYRGVVDCFRRVIEEQGVLSLWRGNGTNCLRFFPNQALTFAFKDQFRDLFYDKFYNGKPSVEDFSINLASGAIAGAGSLTILYPLDYARTRLAADVGRSARTFNGLVHCIMTTAKGPKGVLGLYNGLGISIAGITIYRGIFFGIW